MQPTVRRARRTADTRGYAHRKRAARCAGGAHARSTHRDSLKLEDVAKRSAAPISARRAVMGGRARAERRSPAPDRPREPPAAGHVVDRGGIEIPLHRRDLLGQFRPGPRPVPSRSPWGFESVSPGGSCTFYESEP
jgi:hypothetical protein